MGARVVLIDGDGIGPEISQSVCSVLDHAGAGIEWLPHLAGLRAIERHGEPLPEQTLAAIRDTGVALKGPISTPIGRGAKGEKNFRSVNVALRKGLELYANLRPVRSVPGIKTRYEGVDLIFIRENTEGLYSGLEQEIVPGVVTSLKVSTRTACIRIAEYAFRYAAQHGRKKVTGIHKANIMKLSDGLAIECYREIAAKYPQITYDERIIDATAMALVMDPSKFDVLLMENLYGDILSDLGAGLIGGLGLAPSANIGTNGAVFEAVHGSAPDIAGKGIANPTALLLSATEMLRYLGQGENAARIDRSVYATLAAGKGLTPDLGGTASTKQYTDLVIANLK